MLRLPLFGAGSGSFLLDVLGQPAGAAFAVRRLSVSYRGAALNVRRSSDNATLDIEFLPNGSLDTSTFSGFIGAGSGFVTKLYDQSGNGRDASQSTAASQPQLVLNAIGGRPALQFSGSQYLSTVSFASITSVMSFAAVAERTGSFTSQQSLVEPGSGPSLYWQGVANNFSLFGSSTLSTTASDSAAHSFVGVVNGSSSIVGVDGTETGGNAGNGTAGNAQLYIGAQNGSSFLLTGDVCELLVYLSTALTSSQRSLIHANQSAYYGTP